MADANRRNGVQRRRHHLGGPQIRRLMPTRPKKPPTAYTNFIREFFRTRTARSSNSPSESMSYAGRFWRANPDIHARYIEEATTAQANFARDIARFRVQQKVLRRPGNAFNQFSVHLWHTEGRASGRSIADHGKFAGEAWKRLTPAAKQPFIDRSNAARAEHARMLDDIGRGFTRVENYVFDNPTTVSSATAICN